MIAPALTRSATDPLGNGNRGGTQALDSLRSTDLDVYLTIPFSDRTNAQGIRDKVAKRDPVARVDASKRRAKSSTAAKPISASSKNGLKSSEGSKSSEAKTSQNISFCDLRA